MACVRQITGWRFGRLARSRIAAGSARKLRYAPAAAPGWMKCAAGRATFRRTICECILGWARRRALIMWRFDGPAGWPNDLKTWRWMEFAWSRKVQGKGGAPP